MRPETGGWLPAREREGVVGVVGETVLREEEIPVTCGLAGRTDVAGHWLAERKLAERAEEEVEDGGGRAWRLADKALEKTGCGRGLASELWAKTLGTTGEGTDTGD